MALELNKAENGEAKNTKFPVKFQFALRVLTIEKTERHKNEIETIFFREVL